MIKCKCKFKCKTNAKTFGINEQLMEPVSWSNLTHRHSIDQMDNI